MNMKKKNILVLANYIMLHWLLAFVLIMNKLNYFDTLQETQFFN